MANAITKRQSKSYHVNKNDMQFCTQKLQLKDWQQNFMMYNQQADIFKGRKKTDIQIQIELLREYCLQLNGKELRSPQDITPEDIKCLNADIDLFYQQAASFDSTKELPLISSTFPQSQNSNKQLSSSSTIFNYMKHDMNSIIKNNIEDEVELGLNTHSSKPTTLFAPDIRTPQYNMYDSQTSLTQSVQRPNQKVFKNVPINPSYSKYDIDIQEQQIQIKKENIGQEAINYINTQHHQNQHVLDSQTSSHRKPSPVEDQQMYFTHYPQGNQMRNLNQPQQQFLNHPNSQDFGLHSQNMMNSQNHVGQQYSNFLRNQNPIQDVSQSANFLQQFNQNQLLVQQGGIQQPFQQLNKITVQPYGQDSNEYIRTKTNDDIKKNQQLFQGENIVQDNVFTIYNHQDKTEQVRQKEQTIKECEDDKEFYDPEVQNIMNRGQNTNLGFGMTQLSAFNNVNQTLEDPEQYQYMNSRANQQNNFTNINLQQQIYDGKNQYINQHQRQQFEQQQIHQMDQIQQLPNELNADADIINEINEEKIKHEEIPEMQTYSNGHNQSTNKQYVEEYNQFNPQDGGELAFNYYQYYQNQNTLPNDGDAIEEEMDDKLYGSNIPLNQQSSFNGMYQFNNNNNFTYDQTLQYDNYNQQQQQQMWNQNKYN